MKKHTYTRLNRAAALLAVAALSQSALMAQNQTDSTATADNGTVVSMSAFDKSSTIYVLSVASSALGFRTECGFMVAIEKSERSVEMPAEHQHHSRLHGPRMHCAGSARNEQQAIKSGAKNAKA